MDLPNHRPSDCQDKVRRPARVFYNAVVSTFQMFSGRPAIPGPYVTSQNVTSFASSFEMSSGAAGEALLTGRRPSPSFKLEDAFWMKASAKEIGKAQSIAERTAAPVDPRLRPNRFQDIRPDVANDLAQGAARSRSALAPEVIGVGDLRVAKPNP